MIIIDIIGWIGNIFFIFGAYFLSKHKIIGFYCNTIANILYVIFSVLVFKSSLLAISILLAGINIYGILQWKIKLRRVKNA